MPGTPSPTYASLANRMLTGFARVGEKQIYEHLVVDDYGDNFLSEDAKPAGACALGCLMLGEIKDLNRIREYISSDAYVYWPGNAGELRRHVLCPADHSTDAHSTYWARTLPITDVITHLNDGHKWTVPEIATWLKGLDEQPAA